MNEYKWENNPSLGFLGQTEPILFKVQSINGKRSHISAAGVKTDLSAFFPTLFQSLFKI